MKVLELLDVYLWDGGERHNYAYTFDGQLTCESDLKNKFKHCFVQAKTIVIYDNITDFEDKKKEIERQKVLAKLTKEERQLLGL